MGAGCAIVHHLTAFLQARRFFSRTVRCCRGVAGRCHCLI